MDQEPTEPPKNCEEYAEGVICKESDIPENSMKEFSLGPGGGKVLVVKQRGRLYAIGTTCTHFGGQLAAGTLGNGRVRCPWHGACFNLKSGDIEDHPGLDSLPCYEVSVLPDGDVKVRAKMSILENNKRVKRMVRKNPEVKHAYIIIGGGVAGLSCAEVLRQEGFTGSIIMISDEKHLPYDRIFVSKSFDKDIAEISFRQKGFYEAYDIEVLTGETVVSVNTVRRTVTTESGKDFIYCKLFIAVGLKSRRLTHTPGYNLENIFTIRKFDDSNTIGKLLAPNKNVVIVGSSFIAMEAAAFCVDKVKSVTVLGKSREPFQKVFGLDVGRAIRNVYEAKGVKIIMNVNVKCFKGTSNKVTQVIYTGSENLALPDDVIAPADICIVAVGSSLDLKFLEETHVKLSPEGFIDVNKFMETNVKDIYAGGDIAFAPVTGTDGIKASIGHFQVAQQHGRIAALNILKKKTELKSVPYFFTTLFNYNVRYAGFPDGFDDVVIEGNLPEMKFVSYYCKGDNVVAVASINQDPIVSQWAEYIYNGKKLSKSEITDNQWIQSYKI